MYPFVLLFFGAVNHPLVEFFRSGSKVFSCCEAWQINL